ncbi:hypothetical protein [Paucilactobacillus sp. N302-9]
MGIDNPITKNAGDEFFGEMNRDGQKIIPLTIAKTYDGKPLTKDDDFCTLWGDNYFRDESTRFLSYLIATYGADQLLAELGAEEHR